MTSENPWTGSGCPLCGAGEQNAQKLESADGRSFYHCEHCWLIYCDRNRLPDPDTEKTRYLEHQNTHDNAGYVEFLNIAVEPAISYFKPGMQGLDFGCGPVPVLAKIVSDSGYPCSWYDPIFYPVMPGRTFDFIFSTEAIEHFHHPDTVISKITDLLKPGGILTIMTECWTDLNKFRNWYYVRDKTHVSLFHEKTFDFVAEKYGLPILSRPSKRVTIMRKN